MVTPAALAARLAGQGFGNTVFSFYSIKPSVPTATNFPCAFDYDFETGSNY